METYTFGDKTYDITFGVSETVRHGGPFDRGSADSYYGRSATPHYFVGDTLNSHCVEKGQMTQLEKLEYYAGFEYNEEQGDKKEW